MTAEVRVSDDVEDALHDVEHLRRIQIVTDASLAHLDVEELLDTLLTRAREALEADTAAILLADRTSGEMVATAAKGLEEEVRGGVRIPIGQGFAGRVAAERRAVILEHVDHTKVLNPILLELGIRTLLGVPLIANGELIGVLHVGTLVPRAFSPNDAEVLQLVADRAALAINGAVLRRERVVATSLQRSLLPRLPRIAQLEAAARYVPGERRVVGGDWYDLFELPTGHVGAAIGDVVGHGLHSAMVMGRLRYALRAYAFDSSDPATVLMRLDEMVSHFEDDEMATVLYAVLDPAREHLTFSSAGHPPPVMALPNEPQRLLEAPADPPIGSGLGGTRHTTELALPPDATLYFFTDGVFERHEHIDVGLDRVRRAVTADSPHRGCTRILSQLGDAARAEDDLAILGIHIRR